MHKSVTTLNLANPKIRSELLLLVAVLVGCGGLDKLKERCKKGEPEACVAACDKGELGEHGCLGAAEAYAEGQGVPKNEKRARSLAEQACDGKVADGCMVAASLSEGSEAFSFHEKACDLGHEKACDRVLDGHIKAATVEHKDDRIPKVLSALKSKCAGDLAGCRDYSAWLKQCAESWFMYDGITGLKCADGEPECRTKKMAATKPFCAGERKK